eukprot:50344-Pelagomonas_calceolata.AAC.2
MHTAKNSEVQQHSRVHRHCHGQPQLTCRQIQLCSPSLSYLTMIASSAHLNNLESKSCTRRSTGPAGHHVPGICMMHHVMVLKTISRMQGSYKTRIWLGHPERKKQNGQYPAQESAEASKQQQRDLCCHLSRASAQVNLHTILSGVGGVICIPHTLEPLKELGLDTHAATRLALKLYAHSVQYAYKLASTRRALEKTSFNSHQRDQARATASNPPDPH